MTFGSLFSGIGGMDLGLERAGMRVVWQSEIDPYACRVLARHWPGVPNLGDIARIDWSAVERPDLVCGGFPCQDISFAGKGAGLAGERSGLWYEFARCVRDLRPRYVLVENVAALLVRGLDAVLGTLASLGYDAEWDCIPAAAFGAPHERERVFLAAYSGRLPRFGRVFFHGEDAIPRDEQWRSSQGIQSGRGWKRWLKQAASDLDRQASDPWFCGLDDGFSSEVVRDQYRGFGNAVVPQVAEWIGRRLMEAAD